MGHSYENDDQAGGSNVAVKPRGHVNTDCEGE